MSKNEKSTKLFFTVLIILFILVILLSFAAGRYPLSPLDVIKVIVGRIFKFNFNLPRQASTVVFQIRMPRIILALFIGAALSTSGLVYQGLFQNPMVSPDVLGTSSGAGFGAAVAILLSMNYFEITMVSFLFGLIAVALVLLVSRSVPSQPVLSLILAGIMISSLFSSLVSFVKLVADPENTLPAVTYFLMGSLSSVRTTDIPFAVTTIVVSLIPIIALRWQLNVMSLGEDEARSLGVNTRVVRLVSIICATLMTAVTVAVAGMIGWVGLVIPHFVRLFVGPDYRKSVPASILMGATFLLAVDTISRIVATIEIPLGILTSFIGSPLFLYLIIREGRR